MKTDNEMSYIKIDSISPKTKAKLEEITEALKKGSQTLTPETTLEQTQNITTAQTLRQSSAVAKQQ